MKPSRIQNKYYRIKVGNIVLVQEFCSSNDNNTIFDVYDPVIYEVEEKTYFTDRTLVVRKWDQPSAREEYIDDFGPNRLFYVLGIWDKNHFGMLASAEMIKDAVLPKKQQPLESIIKHFR